MSVPDTNTFSLQDVVNEIVPSSDTLSQCFSDANPAGFDPTYEGSKDRLSNFRNYDHASATTSLDYNGSCDIQSCYEIDAVNASNGSLGMAMSGCAAGSAINFAYSGTKSITSQTFKFRILWEENSGSTSLDSITIPISTSSTFNTNFDWSFEASGIGYVDGTTYDSEASYFLDTSGSSNTKWYITVRFNRVNTTAGTESCNLNGIILNTV